VLLAAEKCTYMHALDLQTPTRNLNFLGRATLELPDDWQASATASLFNSEARQVNTEANTGWPYGLANVGVQPGTPPVVVGPQIITVPANYPGNPFGSPAPLVYTFNNLGSPAGFYETNTYRLALELRGQIGGWDIAGSAELQYARTEQKQFDQINPTLLQTALDNGYLVGEQASPGGAALFAPEEETSATSTMNVLSINANRTLLHLPGGPLALGSGADFYQRVANQREPPAVEQGLQGGNNSYAIGSQDDLAAFAELDARPVKPLELSAAARYDHYNTYGGSLTPKFGIRVTPWQHLTLEGTWGRGFRAPNPAEAQQAALAFDYGVTSDPVLCPNPGNPVAPGNFPSQCAVSIPALLHANAKLKPERSTNMMLGFKLQPLERWQLGADYYRVSVDDVILPSYEAAGFENSSVQFGNLVRGPSILLPFVNPDGSITNHPTPVGVLIYQPLTYINATSTATSGIDLNLAGSVPLGPAGTLSARLDFTHVISYNIDAFGLTYELAGTHGPSAVSGDTGNPRDRAQLSVTWAAGPASVRTTFNYIGAFSVLDPSAGQNTCAEAEAYPAFPPGAAIPGFFCTVRHFTDVDLYASYRLGTHLSVHGSILNLSNTPPPLDFTTYGGPGGVVAYNPAFHQAGAVGRFFTLGLTASL
jgi:iron complex outermembrane receptor protein